MFVFGSIPGACCLMASILSFSAMDKAVGLSKCFSRSCMISRQVSISVSSIMGALLKKKSWVDRSPLPGVSSLSPGTWKTLMAMPRGPDSVSGCRKTGSLA